MGRDTAKRTSADIQREVLGVLSAGANISVVELSKLLRLKPHVVRYNLQALLEGGEVRCASLVNPRAVGMLPVNIFFDLPITKTSKAVAFMQERPEVSWFTTVSGPRRFEATCVFESYEKHSNMLRDLSESAGTHLRDQVFAVEGEQRYWGLRFLMKRESISKEARVHFTARSKPYSLDAMDKRILKAVTTPAIPSITQAATTLRIPQATLKYRLDKLRAEQVISEVFYFLVPNTRCMSAQIVLNLRSHGAEQAARVIRICEEHLNVEALITGVGAWDYKILIMAESFNQIMAIEQFILQALARDVARSSLYLRGKVLSGKLGL